MTRANQIASASGAISNSARRGKIQQFGKNPNGSAGVSFEALAPTRWGLKPRAQ